MVRTDSANFVFDYWMDSNGDPLTEPCFLDSLEPEKPLLVFVSHGHKDHFNKDVFAWAARFPQLTYVVSRDVMKRVRHIVSPSSVYSGPKVAAGRVMAMRAGDVLELCGTTVAAFPSTDIGNSYMVECDGIRIFHAGDLNAWIWKDESTEAEVRKALGDYRACLRDVGQWLAGRPSPEIDYCFFPVDSRIGRDYFTGAAEFVRRFNVEHFFPMHFALGDAAERKIRSEDAIKFPLYANQSHGEYIALVSPGTSYFNFNQ